MVFLPRVPFVTRSDISLTGYIGQEKSSPKGNLVKEFDSRAFVERLKIAFQEQSIEKIATRMGVIKQSIYKWQRGATKPTIDKLLMISELTGYSIHWLLTGEGEEVTLGDEDTAMIFIGTHFEEPLMIRVLKISEQMNFSLGDTVAWLTRKGFLATDIENSIKSFLIDDVATLHEYPSAASHGIGKKAILRNIEEFKKRKDIKDGRRAVQEDEDREDQE